jgi:hypothetical protein
MLFWSESQQLVCYIVVIKHICGAYVNQFSILACCRCYHCCCCCCCCSSELKPEGLLCIRPWHDENIAVMAPSKSGKLLVNAIIRETLSTVDKERLSWTGNILLLSSSLQPELAPDLGGVTCYALEPLLQVGFDSSSATAAASASS